jgi:hypothetical protein
VIWNLPEIVAGHPTIEIVESVVEIPLLIRMHDVRISMIRYGSWRGRSSGTFLA